MDYTIEGNTIVVNNSKTGITKFECKQFEDRIEYTESDDSTRIMYVLENGDIEFNDNITLIKLK